MNADFELIIHGLGSGIAGVHGDGISTEEGISGDESLSGDTEGI